MSADEIVRRSADYGPAVFLLIVTWMALAIGGFWIVKNGWALATRMADKADVARLALVAALDKVAESSQAIAEITKLSAKQTEQIQAMVIAIERQNAKHTRVASKTLEILRELTPAEKTRITQLLDEARAMLEDR